MKQGKIPYGPTYEEMLYPDRMDPDIRKRALKVINEDELDPINLFNITWKDKDNQVRKIVLPKELTGVDANIVVMLGKEFPSGSHKVGPAYSTLMEGCVDGEIIPGEHTILGPSTGNFGIGVSYICRLMGYKAVVIMPDNMSIERYERIRRYGAELDLTPGTESDVILTLERTNELKRNPKNKALAQFELMPNYRFHRFVTGNSAVEAVKNIGNGRIAAFCSAPGSAGTMAAGDTIKKAFPECKITALEPLECSTLSNGGRGQHQIEGIGDKMCTLIHNILTTDYIALIHDEDCVKALKIIHDAPHILEKLGVEKETAQTLSNLFGISGLCNILGAIKMAKYLKLGPEDNVVTIATDSVDRYHSVLRELDKRYSDSGEEGLNLWVKEIFNDMDDSNVYEFQRMDQKEALFLQKEKDWMPFGYSKEYLDSMKNPEFWETEFNKTAEYDQRIKAIRERIPL